MTRFLLAASVAWLGFAPASAAVANEDADAAIYQVEPGDTLWTIAARAIGDATLWPALYLANRDQIKDPARVYPGQRLAIPEVDPAERAELRREAEALVK